MWILNYLDDLDADFRVFYRIDGIADGYYANLSAERFITLCERTFSYKGAMRMHAELLAQEQADATNATGAGTGTPGAPVGMRDDDDEFDDEELEDEVEAQDLADLQLEMEVRTDARGDGARVAS